MIAAIQGTLFHDGRDHVVVMAAGVGYKLFCPPTVTGQLGDVLTLHTTLVVREDSMTLFGFNTDSERDLFELLLTISGVGPKVALSILSTLSHDALRNAVVADYTDINSDVIDSLVALGYSIVEAQTAVQALPPDAPADLEERLRLALQYFA
ncbi:MAG: Holliday junction branch migration protein RuvA [Anaerolineae bacterium]|nr:Holliday junction branch migration protein RuvA [Anaerolineae bacterium]